MKFADQNSEWDRTMELFDRLVESGDPETLLAREPDDEVRSAALSLWRHHSAASSEKFLEKPIDIELLPVFGAGQILRDRFEVQAALGRGGMGEVYLAFDRTIGEPVALKTVRRELAASEQIKLRFIAEVRSARRVTHTNVCRIHDLFEDSEAPFFAMEYLDGRLLSELLKGPPIDKSTGKDLVLQIAEGLYAAHKNGVIHGDLKPGNIMIVGEKPPRAVIMDFGLAQVLGGVGRNPHESEPPQGGTLDYMAPELLRGSPCTVATDIYAFGKVARLLMPGRQRLWDACCNEDARSRPGSLKLLIEQLRRDVTRRYWLTGAAAITAGAIYYGAQSAEKRSFSLPSGARILLNGFRSSFDMAAAARLVRSLMMTALLESSRIRAIADLDLLPTLRRMEPKAALPVEGTLLHALLAALRASYWIEANFSSAGSRHSLELRVWRTAPEQLVGQIEFRDLPSLLILAQQAALWLRRTAGESDQSLLANPVAVSSESAPVPEALQSYYNAMEHYAVAEMAQAIPLLKEAVRLDPKFAQAHSVLGMTMVPFGRFDEAFQEVERGMQLAGRLSLREQTWIQTNYYTLEEDPVQMVELARRSLSFFPDEPRFYRVLAHTLCRSGKAPESILYSKKAIELSPANILARTDLVFNLCEAGQFEEARKEFEAALTDARFKDPERARYNNWIYEPGGLAYLGLEHYDEANEAFGKVPDNDARVMWEQGVNIMRGRFDAAGAALREYRTGARSVEQSFHANEYLCAVGFVTGQLRVAQDCLAEMTKVPAFPPMARLLDCALFWAFRLPSDTALARANELLSQIGVRWQNSFTHAVELHGKALTAWRRKALDEAERLLIESCGSAFSVWALFDLAEFYTRTKPALAESYWSRLDEHRGTLLERWFPGSLVFAWLGRAQAAQRSGDGAAALKYSQKVLDHWWIGNSQAALVQAAKLIHTASKSPLG